MSHSNDNQTSKVWYLAQLKPNSHRIAEVNLSRQGFESFCPMAMETKRQRGKFIKAEKPLFPVIFSFSMTLSKAPGRRSIRRVVSRVL